MDFRALCRATALALACAFLAACGNGSGDTSSTEVSVEGHWSGTYTAPGKSAPVPVAGMIQKGGLAYYRDDNGVLYKLPALNGAYTFHGEVTAYAPIGYRFTSGRTDEKVEIQGTAADSGISADLQNASGKGSLDLSPLETFQDPAVVPGQWTGYYITPTPYFVGLTVSESGGISGNDVFGCALKGRIAQRPGENVFDVTLDTTGPAPVCGAHFSGLAHEADYDTFGYYKNAPGTYYYLGLFSEDTAIAAELKV